jgi:2-polyprenyl-3-methyl-5-hydroxy-6-metoxy-1,4-benzoquinol methylase
MRREGDAVAISGDYQYRALTEGMAVQRFWHHTKILAVQKYLPPRTTDVCLDVGCGSGIVSSFIGKHAGRVLGIDCNPSAVEFATRQFAADNVAFRLGYIDATLDEDASVDKIYCLEVIEHVYIDQAVEMLGAFHRVLKPGGAVLLSTPNSHSTWPLIEWTMDRLGLAPKLAEDQHVETYHRRKMAGLCKRCGFDVATNTAMCLAAPWLAVLHWGLAERCFQWESCWTHNPGSILITVLRKPA